MKGQHGSLEDRIETAIRLPPAEGAPDAGVMDLLASIRVLFDGQFLPLASQIQLFQYVIEEHVQRKLRVRPPGCPRSGAARQIPGTARGSVPSECPASAPVSPSPPP